MITVRTKGDYRRMRARLRWLCYRARVCAALDLWEAGSAYRACAERIEQRYPFLQLACQAARQDPLWQPVVFRLDDWQAGLDVSF